MLGPGNIHCELQDIRRPLPEQPAEAGCASLRLRVDDDARIREVIAAANEAVELRGFAEVVPSMNDVFIRAVSGSL